MEPTNPESEKELSDEDWINDRMKRLVASQESTDDFNNILLKGMTRTEMRAFCLGVKAGKHASARTVLDELSKKAMETALVIDPFIK